MSERNWQAPAGTAVRATGRPAGPFHSAGPGAAPVASTGPAGSRLSGPPGSSGSSASTAGTGRAAGAAGTGGAAGVRLTGRGAMAGVFVLCFLGLIVADWTHWGVLAGGTFVTAWVLAALRTQRSDLLTVAVTPPALFLVAVICEKVLMPTGSLVLSTTEGTLITLANTAPWLLAGLAVSLIIAFSRGLWQNVRALGRDLRGDPVRKPSAQA